MKALLALGLIALIVIFFVRAGKSGRSDYTYSPSRSTTSASADACSMSAVEAQVKRCVTRCTDGPQSGWEACSNVCANQGAAYIRGCQLSGGMNP
jgi:hypothetical protein